MGRKLFFDRKMNKIPLEPEKNNLLKNPVLVIFQLCLAVQHFKPKSFFHSWHTASRKLFKNTALRPAKYGHYPIGFQLRRTYAEN